MNKSEVMKYVHNNIEAELEIIKKIHYKSKGTSFLSDAKNKSVEDKRYLICMEDIKMLYISGFISAKICHELKDTVNSARQWIEV